MRAANEAARAEADGSGRRPTTPSLTRQLGFSFRKKLWLKSRRGGSCSSKKPKRCKEIMTVTENSSASTLRPDVERRSYRAEGNEMVLTSVRGRSSDAYAMRVFAHELSRHVEENFGEDDGLGYEKLSPGAVLRDVEVAVEVERAEVLKEREERGQVLVDVRVVYTQDTRYSAEHEFDDRRALVEGPFRNRWSREAFGKRLKREVPGRMGAFEWVGSVGYPVISDCADDMRPTPTRNTEDSDQPLTFRRM